MSAFLPTLIRAKDTADLVKQAQAKLEAGMDLHSPLFVSEYGGLCQWMIASRPFLYEYRLIDAAELSDLELETRNLTELGFDFVFNTVLWRGRYLQWMCRAGNRSIGLADVARAKNHQLVVGVQTALNMDTVDASRYASISPFLSSE